MFFLILKGCSLPLELVYCLIVFSYMFDVSNDSSLYIVKKMFKNFEKKVLFSEKMSQILSLKQSK